MKRRFFAFWNPIHNITCKEEMRQIVGIERFDEQYGYSQQDLAAINALEVGQLCVTEIGEHEIIRLTDKSV